MFISCEKHGKEGGLTFDEMMLLAWTNMLYNAEATVLVRTDPALRLVIATSGHTQVSRAIAHIDP